MLRILKAAGFVLIVLVSVYAGTIVGPMLTLAWRSSSPAQVSWDSKSAFVKCAPAIAHPADWPREPKAACAAMTMCGAEAELTGAEMAALRAAARRLPDCPAF